MKPIHVKVLFLAGALVFLAISCRKETTGSQIVNGRSAQPVLPEEPYAYFGDKKSDWAATLGRVLFYDKILSVNNATACADCHKQERGFADVGAFSVGFNNRITSRNSMALANLDGSIDNVFGGSQGFFWDLRERSLNSMVLRPISNHIEMGIEDMNVVIQKIRERDFYARLFEQAGLPVDTTGISTALTAFMRTLNSQHARVDAGDEALTDLERKGKQLFTETLPCNSCHNEVGGGFEPGRGGWSGGSSANIGLEVTYADKGMGERTGEESLEGVFKIPTLRNIEFSAPYMHDGRFATLEEVVNHYSEGIQDHKNLDFRLRDIQFDGKGRVTTFEPRRWNLSASDKQALIAFLKTFSDPVLLHDEKYSDPFVLQ